MIKYAWKRFWYPRGSNLNLADDGYLPDPDSQPGRIWNPQVAPFKAIARERCLVLLGDPGMGKSTILAEQEAAWTSNRANSEDKSLFINLRSYQTDIQLSAELFQGTVFKKWLHGTNTLHLFLDSLDEGLLSIRVLAARLIDEFKKLPAGRLYLRIACRTTEWPTLLEKGLIEWLGEDKVKFYVLAPLRKKDVEEAAKVTGLIAEAFIEEVASANAVPFALKPITLKFLLATYQKQGSLPSSQYDLYLNGCRLLAAETSESRDAAGYKGELTADQRLAVAARVAACMIFGNRNSVFTGTSPTEAPDGDVTIREIVGGTESVNGIRFNIGEKEIREALGTGLFSTRGLNRIGWGHLTYAEFLAAWYVNEHGLGTSAVVNLITHSSDPDGKIVPQLGETAAWLAGMVPEVFQYILRVEPDLLLRSEVATGDSQQRAALVAGLLGLFETEQIFDRDREHYTNLAHADLAEQLRPYLANKSMGLLVRRVAIDIAEACNLQILIDSLVAVALDPSESQPVRAQAVCAIGRIGDDVAKAKLKSLILGQEANDPDDELKGCALRALWPKHIRANELFSILRPPQREGFIGAYRLFLSSELVPGLSPLGELIPALEFVTNLPQPRDAMDSSLESLMDGIATRAWENMDLPGVTEALAKFVASRLKHHDDLIKGQLGTSDHLIFLQDQDRRRRLLEAVFSVVAGDPDLDIRELVFMQTSLVLVEDFDWLISCLDRMPTKEIQAVIVQLLERLFDPANPNHLEIYYEAGKRYPVIADAFNWVWRPIALGSEEANTMKARHDERQNWLRIRAEKSALAPPPAERVASLLEECEHRNSGAWWRLNKELNKELTLEPTSTHYDKQLEWDITKLPGWASADETTRSRIITAAEKYVLDYDPHALHWFGTNLIYKPAFAGYRAFALLLREKPSFISNLTSDVWRKWSPIILVFDFVSDNENETKGIHDELLKLTYQEAPLALLDALRILIVKENEQGERIHIANSLSAIWDDRIAALLLNKAGDSSIKPKCMGSLLSVLLAHDNLDARSFANNLVTVPLPANDLERTRAVIAAETLFLDAQDAGWTTIWPAVQQDVEFGKQVILGVSQDYVSIGLRLDEGQLAELYVWLTRHFEVLSHESGKAYWAGPLDHIEMWRNAIIQLLTHRGSFRACDAIRRIQQELPELEWLKWVQVDAQAQARRITWMPARPQDIVRLAADRELRLVQNGNHLLGVLVESLERFQAMLQGATPEAQFLWDNAGKPHAEPKDENAFSDYVQRHLDKDLKRRGIIANREVRIHRGQRTDVHVDAFVKSDSGEVYDSVTVIIECKGCWNPELYDAMRDQLVGKYLKDNHCQHGLYLVGWFNCQKWTGQDGRKAKAFQLCPSIEKARDTLVASAVELSKGPGSIDIKALVLDVSLH